MKIHTFIAISILITSSAAAYAGIYKVNVKRIDKDLYKDTSSGVIIQTRYCYEYTYGDEAILKYEQYSYENKLIFNSGTTCDVAKVLK